MRIFCDNCSAEFEAPYWRSGSSYACPSCSHALRLDSLAGRTATDTGYEVTYTDFLQLVSDAYYSDTILPLIRTWFGLERDGTGQGGGAVRFRDPEGNLYEALEVLAWIQNDPSRQRQLYNNAMTLWH